MIDSILSNIKITPLLDTLYLEDIDDSIYFSERYADYISNSRMSLINPAQDGSPQAFFEGLSKNSKFTSNLAFGSTVHELVLQPESFFLCEDINAPTAKVGIMADLLYGMSINGELPNDEQIRNIAIKVDYYKGLPTPSQMKKVKDTIKSYFKERYKFEQNSTDERKAIYLDEKSRDRLLEILSSLNNNSGIQNLLHPKDLFGEPLKSENEKTILLDIQVDMPDVEPFIMKLKAKLDNYTIDPINNIITVNDVKTTGKLCSYFQESIQNFHYNRELAFYGWLLSLCAKKFFNLSNPIVKGNFLVVETVPSYKSSIESMKTSWFKAGVKEFLTLLKMIAYYKIHGYEKV